MVDRLGTVLRGIDQDAEVLLDAILSGELVEPPGADRRLEGELLGGHVGAGDALDRHRSGFTLESNM